MGSSLRVRSARRQRLQRVAHLHPNGKKFRCYTALNPTAITRSMRVESFALINAQWHCVNTQSQCSTESSQNNRRCTGCIRNATTGKLMRPAPHIRGWRYAHHRRWRNPTRFSRGMSTPWPPHTQSPAKRRNTRISSAFRQCFRKRPHYHGLHR